QERAISRAREDHHPGGAVSLQGGHQLVQLTDHHAVDRVELLRSIERDRDQGPVRVDPERLECHPVPPCRARAGAPVLVPRSAPGLNAPAGGYFTRSYRPPPAI